MQNLRILCTGSFLAAALSGNALADPQLGNWNSQNDDFQVGNWTETFSGGGVGAVDNVFAAAGLEDCCFSLEDALLTAAEMTGENPELGITEYEVSYEGATLSLPNTEDLPWYSAGDADAAYLVEALSLVMNLAVTTEEEEISSIRFDIAGSGSPTGYPDITVSFSAHYEGLPEELAEPDRLEDILDGASIAITRSTMVKFSIKPYSCDNPVNVKSRGVIAAVIAGSESFDIDSLDMTSIRLAGVAPVRSVMADIIEADPEAPCDAPIPDEFDDLVIKFDTQELMAAIGGHELEHRTEVVLPLTANITDQDTIESEDFIWIINPSMKAPKNKPDHAGPPTEPGNQGKGKGWGPDNNPSWERGKGKANKNNQ